MSFSSFVDEQNKAVPGVMKNAKQIKTLADFREFRICNLSKEEYTFYLVCNKPHEPWTVSQV